MEDSSKSLWGQFGSTLLNGVGAWIDSERKQNYGIYGGQLVADPQGNLAAAGQPFGTLSTAMTPANLFLIGGAVLLLVLLIKKG